MAQIDRQPCPPRGARARPGEPAALTAADSGPGQGPSPAGSPRQQQQSRQIAQLRDAAPASAPSGGVVQRMVAPGAEPGTQVKVKRSTSRQLHGAKGQILGPGETPFEYLVEVQGETYTLSFDQLAYPDEALAAVPLESGLQELQGQSPQEILGALRQHVAEQTQLPLEHITVGGSFAVLLHALESGQAARTPRDIDIFVPRGTKSSVMGTINGLVWHGIRLEAHMAGAHGAPTATEVSSGLLGKNTLLAKELIKLLDQTHVFREVVPKPKHVGKKKLTAEGVVADMEARTQAMLLKLKAEGNFQRDGPIWIKTLKDIRALVASGATLEQFEKETDPWD